MPPRFASVDRFPWLAAFLAGAGALLLVAGGVALFAPPEALDALSALGDRKLWMLASGVFVFSGALTRVAFGGRGPEDEPMPEPAAAGAAHPADGHLR